LALVTSDFVDYVRCEFEHPNIKLVDAPQIEISASFIRKAIREKKDVAWFLPKGAAQYIEEMNFYKK